MRQSDGQDATARSAGAHACSVCSEICEKRQAPVRRAASSAAGTFSVSGGLRTANNLFVHAVYCRDGLAYQEVLQLAKARNSIFDRPGDPLWMPDGNCFHSSC
jgi:hypothetical protein